MEIGTAEITSIIKKQIEDYDKAVKVEESGHGAVHRRRHRAHLRSGQRRGGRAAGVSQRRVYGMALNLEEDNVGAALFGESHLIKEGDRVSRTGRIVEVPCG